MIDKPAETITMRKKGTATARRKSEAELLQRRQRLRRLLFMSGANMAMITTE
jgi:hypothetical protein